MHASSLLINTHAVSQKTSVFPITRCVVTTTAVLPPSTIACIRGAFGAIEFTALEVGPAFTIENATLGTYTVETTVSFHCHVLVPACAANI
jgi:hypothetical protein